MPKKGQVAPVSFLSGFVYNRKKRKHDDKWDYGSIAAKRQARRDYQAAISNVIDTPLSINQFKYRHSYE